MPSSEPAIALLCVLLSIADLLLGMPIHLASDHAGYHLKERVKKMLEDKGFQVKDHGAFSFEPEDDYPDFISQAAAAVSKNPEDKGIIFGGSGQGEAMAANRYPNVRAAVFYAPGINLADKEGGKIDPFEIVKLSRTHNDANVLSIGARFAKEEDALKAIEIWLATPFSGEARHARRIHKF